MAELKQESFGSVFDADNHYWETQDAFMRYRDPKFRDRGLQLVEHEGAVRYFMNGELWPLLPGPGDLHLRPVPGSMVDFFAGRESRSAFMTAFTQKPAEHPEYFNRDARLRTMDAQGLEGAWLFPSHGVCIEGPMQNDIEASLNIMTGFNRWIDDEWGFAYKNRIFGVPTLSLTDLDLALRELDWVLERGARIITMRHGPAFTKDGYRSPADPSFDPFWARVEEARITMAIHAGSEQSYWEVATTMARAWNVNFDKQKLTDAMGSDPRAKRAQDYAVPFIMMLQKGRAVQDNAATLIAHGLYERFPRLRVAFIEFGATWVPTLLHNLQHAHGQNPGMFATNPVDQFYRNCWVAPFVEDDVSDVGKHMPAERILFGSDWPHGEGAKHPRDFFDKLTTFSPEDVRKIMVENARELTYA